jgi:hypothetical protein
MSGLESFALGMRRLRQHRLARAAGGPALPKAGTAHRLPNVLPHSDILAACRSDPVRLEQVTMEPRNEA